MAGVSTKALNAIIARELPGWELAPDLAELVPGFKDTDMASNVRNEKGPSLDQLRRKFLGEDATDGSNGDGKFLGEVNQSVETVRVQPKHGGAAKTADIYNGKVAIVQG